MPLVGKLGRAALLPLGLACMYVLHALVAKRFGIEGYGSFSLVLASSSLIAIAMTAGLPAAAQRYVAKYRATGDEDAVSRFVAFGLWWTIVSVAVVMAIAFCLQTFLPGFLPPTIVYLVPLVSTSSAVWLWQRYICLGNGQIIAALVPRDIVFVVMAVVCVWLMSDGSIERFLSVYAILMLFCCLPVLIYVTRGVPGTVHSALSLKESRGWLLSGRAFLLTTALQLGLNSWDVILLGLLSSLEETGRYAAATRFAMVVLLVTRVVNTLYGHRFASLHATGDVDKAVAMFSRLRKFSAMSSVALLMLVLVAYPFALTWMGNEFKSAGALLVALSLVNVLLVSAGPVIQFLNMTGREHEVARTLGLWSLISVVSNIMAIPLFGAAGAATVYGLSNIGMRCHLLRKMEH